MERAEQRMEVFDRRLEAMRKLVEAGMKIVTRMGQRQQAMEEAILDLAKSQKAFLDSLRKAGNGSRHAG
jgi:MoaA/NifB/PqqE/SkfB family radical SAM enzyme